MLVIIGFSAIVVVTVIAVVRSKKPLSLILSEAKYEFLYQIEGTRSMCQDFIMKKQNKMELSPKPEKIAVISGGTRGIGLEVIKMLLKCDMTVILGCRNTAQGEALVNVFKENDITTGKLDVYNLDISVMDSVKKFAAVVKEKHPKINYLINNAGIMFGPYIETKDGFESQFATNYLGHFLLSHLLLPELIAAGEEESKSRIVNVTSCAHRVLGDFKIEDISKRRRYIEGEAYAQSKLAQILFTKYLDKHLKDEKIYVQVHSVHPGIVNTELFDGTTLKNIAPWVPALFFKSPEDGATSVVHACLSKELEGNGGTYIMNCQVCPTSKLADSILLQKKLFEFSNVLLNIQNFIVGK
ncbi:retinol dehydrogenase 11-like [Anoplophora glabripennis]|uniref:retinol dehydrogenase 11-like n=1 Tax=Anoplophora glabripennis TaxID=217634 RepID=UPI000874EDD9|nr:retinol dehydrogenase 11-like [Anoplophora glabripennis]